MSNYGNKCPKCGEVQFHHWEYKRKWTEKCLACGYEPEYEKRLAEVKKKYQRAVTIAVEMGHCDKCKVGSYKCSPGEQPCRERIEKVIALGDNWNYDGSLK